MPDFEPYHQRFSVPFDYPVHFTHGVFAPSNGLLAGALDRLHEGRRHRCMVYVDDGLAAAQPDLLGQVKEYFHARPTLLELSGPPTTLPGGEAAKTSWQAVRDVMWTLGNLHLDRQSFVIAVGGGSFLDMVGFATSLVHRGLRLVRLPSTTLAQNDAGIGVKNGMDEHGVKNFAGAFAPPFAVLNDFDLLATLPFEHWIGGVSEAFKVAIIKDADFFGFLSEHAGALRRRGQAAIEQVIYRCAVLHLEHIRTGGDPFEMGSARPLDFGHWAAHKLEAMSGFRLSHALAVAVGVALDSAYAGLAGLLAGPDVERVLAAMLESGLPVWHETLDHRRADGRLAVLDGLDDFREHLGGTLSVTLPDGLGRKTEVHQMNADLVEQAIVRLKARQRQMEAPAGGAAAGGL